MTTNDEAPLLADVQARIEILKTALTLWDNSEERNPFWEIVNEVHFYAYTGHILGADEEDEDE